MNTPVKKSGRPKRVGPKPAKKAVFILIDEERHARMSKLAKSLKTTVPRLFDLAAENAYPGEPK
jgi:hypothetical protein